MQHHLLVGKEMTLPRQTGMVSGAIFCRSGLIALRTKNTSWNARTKHGWGSWNSVSL